MSWERTSQHKLEAIAKLARNAANNGHMNGNGGRGFVSAEAILEIVSSRATIDEIRAEARELARRRGHTLGYFTRVNKLRWEATCRECDGKFVVSARYGIDGPGACNGTFVDSVGRSKHITTRRPHGHYAKYVGGCRCDPCKEANRVYTRELADRHKAGLGNPLVEADRARKHLLRLQRHGVGQSYIVKASEIGKTTILNVRTGRKTRIRRDTERGILGVTVDAGRFVLDAKPYLAMLDELLALGYPQRWIAERVIWRRDPRRESPGYAGPNSLQVGRHRRMHKNTAAKIEALYRLLEAKGWLTEEAAHRVRVYRHPRNVAKREGRYRTVNDRRAERIAEVVRAEGVKTYAELVEATGLKREEVRAGIKRAQERSLLEVVKVEGARPYFVRIPIEQRSEEGVAA